jgi:hypothetical protein
MGIAPTNTPTTTTKPYTLVPLYNAYSKPDLIFFVLGSGRIGAEALIPEARLSQGSVNFDRYS